MPLDPYTFVTAVKHDGETFELDTVAGPVKTTYRRLLSFTMFSQDVLRDTCTVLPVTWRPPFNAYVRAWIGLHKPAV